VDQPGHRQARGPRAPPGPARLRDLAPPAPPARQTRRAARLPRPGQERARPRHRRRGVPGLAGRSRANPGLLHPGDLAQWLAGSSAALARSANFVRWAVSRRHASRLTAPATRWTGPSGPLDHDRRWADARRLLNDGTCPAPDRVAGLLVLLYAQKLNVITALTTQHVLHDDDRTLLRLGSRPIALPAPLDDLVTRLADGRETRRRSLLALPSPWLFPGNRPGSALTEDALAQRLHAIGISPRQGRSTTLFALAAEIPAAILAKTLGIHVQVAIQWQKISAGDWTAYAADVSRKSTPQPVPS
jgi:hypothetical protein